MKTASHSGGVDCLGLLIGVATVLDLRGTDKKTGNIIKLSELDSINYGHRPDGENLRRTLERYLSVVDGEWQAGDILLCNLDGNPQHLAIVGNSEIKMSGFEFSCEGAAISSYRRDPLVKPEEVSRISCSQGLDTGWSLPRATTRGRYDGRDNCAVDYYQPLTINHQPTIIHAYAQARQVVEHGLDDFWLQSVVGVYRCHSINS